MRNSDYGFISLTNYSLFNESLIDGIKNNGLENFLREDNAIKNTVGVVKLYDRYYCYVVDSRGKTKRYETVDFDTAIRIARKYFHKIDSLLYERILNSKGSKSKIARGYYTLSGNELRNEGIINYLVNYGLTSLLGNSNISNTVGIMYDEGKYVVYENNERRIPFSTIKCDTFEEALIEAREYYEALCNYTKSNFKK